MKLTEEEKEILEGKHSVEQSIYTDYKKFIIICIYTLFNTMFSF